MPETVGSENITGSQLFKTFTVKAWWGIGGALVAIMLGAAALGAWGESVKNGKEAAESAARLAEANSKLDSANSKLDSANSKLERANDRVQEMINVVNDAAAKQRAVESKANFLERFIAYMNAPGEASLATFKQYVCALWKESENHRVHIDASPIVLTDQQVHAGVSAELKDLLISKGVPSDFFTEAQAVNTQVVRTPGVSPFVSPTSRTEVVVTPSQQNAIASIRKVAQSTHLVKTVTFYDGTTYQVPDGIAFAVHTDPNCAAN